MIPTRWGREKRWKSLSQNQNHTLLKGTLTCENIAGFNKKTPKTQYLSHIRKFASLSDLAGKTRGLDEGKELLGNFVGNIWGTLYRKTMKNLGNSQFE